MQQQICDARLIDRFLGNQLSAQEQARFVSHLDGCESCCGRLSELSAAESVWNELRDFLRDEPPGSERDTGEQAPDKLNGLPPSLGFLGPSDDPRMLGRLGPYEILGLIGAGGMGLVLKGLDAALNRYVAIKVLAPQLATDSTARQRFAREAQAAAAVVHDNVIPIYGVDEYNELPYLVMPYVGGSSLQKRIDKAGPLSPSEVLRVAAQTAAGLAAAHAQGLVHRDIKPANLLLPQGVERVRITDFGLARMADDGSLTRIGVIAGTPEFMSPEQARGEGVDYRSDLFSLGSVMYAMCTGQAPFRAETSYGVLQQIVEREPRPIQEHNPLVPAWLVRIVTKLHAKSPADRFDSAREVADLLNQCLAHTQNPAEPLPACVLERPARWRFAARTLKWLLIITVAATLLMFLRTSYFQREGRQFWMLQFSLPNQRPTDSGFESGSADEEAVAADDSAPTVPSPDEPSPDKQSPDEQSPAQQSPTKPTPDEPTPDEPSTGEGERSSAATDLQRLSYEVLDGRLQRLDNRVGQLRQQVAADPAKAEATRPRDRTTVNEPLRRELLVRGAKDQQARQEFIDWAKKNNITLGAQGNLDLRALPYITKQMMVDAANLKWLKSVVQQHGWPGRSLVGRDGAQAAFLIVQHATSDLRFQRQCLDLMQQSPPGDVSPQHLALLVDRVRLAEGKKQLYGTQVEFKDGRWQAKPIEAPELLEQRRREIDLPPLKQYLQTIERVYGGAQPDKPATAKN